jgi:hypothetical protein
MYSLYTALHYFACLIIYILQAYTQAHTQTYTHSYAHLSKLMIDLISYSYHACLIIIPKKAHNEPLYPMPSLSKPRKPRKTTGV